MTTDIRLLILQWDDRDDAWRNIDGHNSAKYGDVSKPCTPGEPQNSWDL